MCRDPAPICDPEIEEERQHHVIMQPRSAGKVSDCVQGSMVFSKLEGASCSIPGRARALLSARGFT